MISTALRCTCFPTPAKKFPGRSFRIQAPEKTEAGAGWVVIGKSIGILCQFIAKVSQPLKSRR